MYKRAITTRKLAATNTRGARIKATAKGGSITLPWDFELEVDGNHAEAAKALIRKLGWGEANGRTVPYVGGVLPNGDYAWAAQWPVTTIRAT